MISGARDSPSPANSRVASRVAVSGRRSITVVIAPSPIAAPGTTAIPGRWEAAIPSAAPMNMDGKIGPPRKEDRETP